MRRPNDVGGLLARADVEGRAAEIRDRLRGTV